MYTNNVPPHVPSPQPACPPLQSPPVSRQRPYSRTNNQTKEPVTISPPARCPPPTRTFRNDTIYACYASAPRLSLVSAPPYTKALSCLPALPPAPRFTPFASLPFRRPGFSRHVAAIPPAATPADATHSQLSATSSASKRQFVYAARDDYVARQFPVTAVATASPYVAPVCRFTLLPRQPLLTRPPASFSFAYATVRQRQRVTGQVPPASAPLRAPSSSPSASAALLVAATAFRQCRRCLVSHKRLNRDHRERFARQFFRPQTALPGCSLRRCFVRPAAVSRALPARQVARSSARDTFAVTSQRSSNYAGYAVLGVST